MIYTRDLPAGHSVEVLSLTHAHVRDHLASVAAEDDDPTGLADRVQIKYVVRPDGTLRVVGELDAEPRAPYLDEGYDPDEAERAGL